MGLRLSAGVVKDDVFGTNRLFRALFICIVVAFSSVSTVRAQVDSMYIASFEEEMSLGTYFYYQYTNLAYSRKGGEVVNYRPNSPIGIGLSFSYKNFSIGAGMGVKPLRSKERGDTKALDLQYHYFGRSFMADLFFQQYKGYYTIDNTEITLYPDIGVVQYGLHAEYVFNHKKFSYPAAFNLSERQLKSAGSFHLGGGFYYNKIRSDSTLAMSGRTVFKSQQLSITGGYGYNWVITNRFHVAASLSVGVNFGTEKLKPIERIEITPTFLPRVAAGYDGNGWSVGVWYVLNSMYVNRYNSLDMAFNTGYAQVTLIKRFDKAPKFLKKIKFLN